MRHLTTRLDDDGDACHTDWQPDTFDHSVTGQNLDDIHAAHDCEECHLDRQFNGKPTCSECHDEDEDGISFPARRPAAIARGNS